MKCTLNFVCPFFQMEKKNVSVLFKYKFKRSTDDLVINFSSKWKKFKFFIFHSTLYILETKEKLLKIY